MEAREMKRWILIIIGVGLILAGILISFASSFAKDVSDTKENTVIIEETYEKFKDWTTALNGEREILYDSVINNLYVELVAENYSKWISSYDHYVEVVGKALDYEDTLRTYCLGVTYANSNVQSKCESMIISYETAINYYVKDVNKFNEFVEVYNSEVEEEQKVNALELGDYHYIDFNDDGKYVGK